MTIAQKVFKLQGEAGIFGKDKQNPHFKYAYASAEAINKEIRPLLQKHGIVAKLQVQYAGSVGDKVCVAEAVLTLIDAEDGSEMEFRSIGSGTDNGDKHAMKAATAASKYATIAAVFGATSDDPEADAKTDANSDPDRTTVYGKDGSAARAKMMDGLQEKAMANNNKEPGAVSITKVISVTRTGRQPYKVETPEGVFNTFDEAVAQSVKAGSAIVFNATRFGNDIKEVIN